MGFHVFIPFSFLKTSKYSYQSYECGECGKIKVDIFENVKPKRTTKKITKRGKK